MKKKDDELTGEPGEGSMFEELISTISTEFVNLSPADVEGHIRDGLKRVVEFAGVDRSTLWQFSEDHRELITAYS